MKQVMSLRQQIGEVYPFLSISSLYGPSFFHSLYWKGKGTERKRKYYGERSAEIEYWRMEAVEAGTTLGKRQYLSRCLKYQEDLSQPFYKGYKKHR